MAREKRTKPCGNCKRSKVKCEYVDSLPCTRCINNNLVNSCQFVLKLPSLTLPPIAAHHVQPSFNVGYVPASQRQIPSVLANIQRPTLPSEGVPVANVMPPSVKPEGFSSGRLSKADSPVTGDTEWRAAMESKMHAVDSRFTELLTALKANQDALKAERERNQLFVSLQKQQRQEADQKQEQTHAEQQQKTPGDEFPTGLPPQSRKRNDRDEGHEVSHKKAKTHEDFRGDVLSLEEAKTLFQYFDTNISQQLFGFEIKSFSVEHIWETSPILICAICTIASMHYPDERISSKQKLLVKHLHRFCTELLFKRPRTQQQGFNTIVALVLCSFWLSDSQRFTGLALQLAKEMKLNDPHRSNTPDDSLSEKDRLKLWYLLYILDGQQSMTFNRQSILSSDDYTLRNSRQLLLSDQSPKSIKNEEEKTEDNNDQNQVATRSNGAPNFTDLRLVSQVEYNQALNEAFKGNAWDLISPNAFGIPSKSNLELDKWMVSWTVLLAPMNNGSVWLSKSTLIYYNFAKMHINSSIIRRLQVESDDDSVVFPNWDNYDNVIESHKNATIKDTPHEADSEDEEDDFISNQEIITQDETILNLNVAVNAAQMVLNLVLNDPDILNNLKYVPVHIHIMLYYAALLLVNPPLDISGPKQSIYFTKIITNLKTVKTLQRKIYTNLPTDKAFGDRLVLGLDAVFSKRLRTLREELDASFLDISAKAELVNELSSLLYTSNRFEVVLDDSSSSREYSPKPERISAWPGSHHGHP